MNLADLPSVSKSGKDAEYYSTTETFLQKFGNNKYVLLRDLSGSKPTHVIPAAEYKTPFDQHEYLYKLKGKLKATKSKYHDQNKSFELEYVFYSYV
jgi:hypothetical protein